MMPISLLKSSDFPVCNHDDGIIPMPSAAATSISFLFLLMMLVSLPVVRVSRLIRDMPMLGEIECPTWLL